VSVADLTRNAVDVLPAGGLEEKLKLGRPLRVKLGIDVTSPDIHIGRAIPLQRMRAFQDEGHTGVLIIGDYTTRIGDPSGRSAERPVLSDEEIDRNAKTYLEQAMVILDPDRTEVRYNGEWLSKLSYAEVVASRASSPLRECSSGTTSRSAWPRKSRSRLGAALSAHAGV
jgi:tyrosyl-tRNA synthetase